MRNQETILFENGHLSDDAIALYTDGLLTGSLRNLPETVLGHAEQCQNCKDMILDLSTFMRNPETRTAAHIVAESQPQKKKKSSTFALSMRIAALFFFGTLLLSTYFYVYKDNSLLESIFVPNGVSVQQEVDTVKPTPVKAKITKDNSVRKQTVPGKQAKRTAFDVNPNLENIVGSSFRSEVVEIISPLNNSTVNSPITFSWKHDSKQPLTLKVIDNKNNLLHQGEVKGNSFEFKDVLKPGLYYWKLENKDDLLYTGKFKANSK
ncbi:MAG: hypothetical protein GY765_40740 [bacterium]|nr:hypothetical protein [bacterium]